MRLKDADKLIEEMGKWAIQESTFGVDEISSPYDAIQECIKVVKGQTEEMGAEETIRTFGELCNITVYENCPIRQTEKEAVPCNELRRKHPKAIAEILKQWKAEHEKKPVETEMAWYIQIVDASNHLLVHEERISMDCNTTADEKKKEILQKWCSEHQGEFYAVSERRCVVRSENT